MSKIPTCTKNQPIRIHQSRHMHKDFSVRFPFSNCLTINTNFRFQSSDRVVYESSWISLARGRRREWICPDMESIKSFLSRKPLNDVINLGMMLTSALIIWKALICITGSESPAVVVLTGSMEPGFKRGDILFLNMNKDPIKAGEIVVFNVDGRDIPIVHRVIKVHEERNSENVNILTKGDANQVDDRGLYAPGQLWLERHHIMGKAVGCLPYVGWATVILKEAPFIKYIVFGVLGLFLITSKD